MSTDAQTQEEAKPGKLKSFLTATIGDFPKFFITSTLSIAATIFVAWWISKTPHLTIEANEIFALQGKNGQMGVFTGTVVNDGYKEAEDVVCNVRVPGATLSEVKVTPENLGHEMDKSGDTITVKIKFLNPSTEERIQISGLARSESSLPKAAKVEARAKGIRAEYAKRQGSISVFVLMGLILVFGTFSVIAVLLSRQQMNRTIQSIQEASERQSRLARLQMKVVKEKLEFDRLMAKQDSLENSKTNSKAVQIVSGFIVLRMPNGNPYDIELSRCNTKGKILEWVAHLSPKPWVTKEHLSQFVDLAAGKHKINLFDANA